MLTQALTRWLLPSVEPSRMAEVHANHVGASADDIAYVQANPPSFFKGRLCRHGHRVEGSNAYRRSNGRIECRSCRAAASRRYRAKARH
jgi:hypothetical protein